MHTEELQLTTLQRNALHECETADELYVYVRRLEKTLVKYAKELRDTKAALQDALHLLTQAKNDMQSYLRYELKSESKVAVGTVADTGEQWIASTKSKE